jgi:hypothetical protein
MVSIEDGTGTARGRWHRPPSAGCSLRAKELPDSFARTVIGLAIISKRQPFKSTFALEMHPTL